MRNFLKGRYLLIIFAVIFLYLTAFSIFRINDTDEGYILTSSMRILNGQLPYRDFFIHTPPVTFYAIAGLFRVFGQSLIAARIFTSLIGLLISILLYLISLRIIPSVRYALIPSLIFMFWGTAQVNYPSFAWFGLLFALASAYLFVLFLDRRSAVLLIGAGLLSGISFMSKQNLGLCVFVTLALFVIVNRFFSGRVIKNLLLLILSFMTPVVIMTYFFYLNGALPDFIEHVIFVAAQSGISRMEIFPYPSVKFPQIIIWGAYLSIFCLAIRRASKGRSFFSLGILMGAILSLVTISVMAERMLSATNYFLDHIKTGAIRGFYNFLVIGCLYSLVISVTGMVKGDEKKTEGEIKVAFLSTFALSYIWAGLFISRDMLHHIFSLPPTYILAGYLFYKIDLSMTGIYSHLRSYAVTLPIIYFMAIGCAVNLNNEVFRDAEGPLYGMRFPVKVERAKYILADRESARDITELVLFIDKDTAKDEKIFYSYWPDGEIYFLADRLPASFYHFLHVDTVKPGDQPSIISDIDANRTRLVFVPKWRYDDRAALSSSAHNTNTYKIEKYIYDNYKVKRSFDRFAVLERTGTI